MALHCSGIRKHYGGAVVLDDVGFAVEPGHIVGIAGPNGAGKTTLFDVVSGYVRPDAGRVELDGRDVTRMPAHGRARLGLARTFQSPLVPIALTVGETLEAARVGWTPRLASADVARARGLARLDAADRQLAGGLDTLGRRKLLLACLLMRRPKVLMLDEPCSGLLRDEIDEIDAIVRNVREQLGLAVVVVEHRLELLFALAERVLVLDEGRRIGEGPPQAVFDEPAVREAYFEAPRSAA